MKFWEV